jgi:hypothetical protein
MSNYYQQYIHSNEWYKKTKKIKKAMLNRCVMFPLFKSSHVHHLTYKRLGREHLIIDCIPLSKFAHWIIHIKLFWKTPLRKLFNLYLRLICLIEYIIFIPIRILLYILKKGENN